MESSADNNKLKMAGNRVIDTSREAVAILSDVLGRAAAKFLKQFTNPVVASRSYRYLARQIARDLAVAEGGKAIVFTSLTAPDINSEVLLMLAYFMQDELQARVLVVDATLRNTGVTRLLQQETRPGMIEQLTGEPLNASKKIVAGLADGKISFIGVGNLKSNPIAYLSEDRVRGVIDDYKREYDYVILQQDYIQEDTRYLLFARLADMVIMHLEERSTPIAKFEEAKNVFREHRIDKVKYILSEP